jgi:starvation-inducible DNA-binding protein
MNERIKQHIADVHIIYVKFHNYHWNVKGLQFKSVHEMTEGYYEWLGTLYDDLAEILLMRGDKPPVTVAGYLSQARIQEEEKTEFSPKEVLEGVLSAFTYLAEELEITRREAAENEDVGLDSFLTDVLGYLEKQIWFVKSSIG